MNDIFLEVNTLDRLNKLNERIALIATSPRYRSYVEISLEKNLNLDSVDIIGLRIIRANEKHNEIQKTLVPRVKVERKTE